MLHYSFDQVSIIRIKLTTWENLPECDDVIVVHIHKCLVRGNSVICATTYGCITGIVEQVWFGYRITLRNIGSSDDYRDLRQMYLSLRPHTPSMKADIA